MLGKCKIFRKNDEMYSIISLCEVRGAPDSDVIVWMVLSPSLFRSCLASSLCGLSPNSK